MSARKNPNWRAAAVAKARTEMTRRMREGTAVIEREVKTLLSVSGPGRGKKTKNRARSLPGEPPRINTGDLRRHVSSTVESVGPSIAGRVGAYRLVYAPVHEYGATIDFPAGKTWQVPAYTRTRMSGGRKFTNLRTRKVSRAKVLQSGQVRAHAATRRKSFQITMPKRPYIAPAVRNKKQEVVDILRGRKTG